MLKRYNLVSIVYGGSGAAYAKQMHGLIRRRSEQERYPIEAKIVMDNVLTGDLLTNVTELFTQTEICLTFLTADDCCLSQNGQVRRVRQNVIFELGMAVYRLGREKCILLSDFDPRDSSIELPSDLKGMDIKYFTEQTREQVFEDVLDKILQLNAMANSGTTPRYDHLLDREDYFVNYEDLFDSCSHLDTREGTAYLKGVLKYWMEECQSFHHYEERCLYFLERIAFLPMFGRHSWVDEWLLQMESLLRSYQQSDIAYCGKKKLNFIKNVAFTVSSIMRLKLHNGQEPTGVEHAELLERLTLEPAEESDVSNPLALTVYYDYQGLLHMTLFDVGRGRYHLDEAIRCFGMIMDQYVEHTDMSLGIWSGFVGYNLARCYMKQYKLTQDPADARKAQRMMLKASMVRKGWLSGTGFHASIRSALSYEYFICKIEQIGTLKMLGSRTDLEIQNEYKRLEGELETYMIRDEQLERLCFVQELLEARQKEISAEDALKESLL
jgi:hypothetical protein